MGGKKQQQLKGVGYLHLYDWTKYCLYM